MAAWCRAALAAATTLASAGLSPGQQSCAASGHCARLDALVSPHHAVAPLCLPLAVCLFANAPTLLLSSRHRASCLWAAAAELLLLWAALASVAGVYLLGSQAAAYGLSLHLSALFLLSPAPPGLPLGSAPHAAARACAGLALLAGAWHAGPPLPVVEKQVQGCGDDRDDREQHRHWLRPPCDRREAGHEQRADQRHDESRQPASAPRRARWVRVASVLAEDLAADVHGAIPFGTGWMLRGQRKAIRILRACPRIRRHPEP